MQISSQLAMICHARSRPAAHTQRQDFPGLPRQGYGTNHVTKLGTVAERSGSGPSCPAMRANDVGDTSQRRCAPFDFFHFLFEDNLGLAYN